MRFVTRLKKSMLPTSYADAEESTVNDAWGISVVLYRFKMRSLLWIARYWSFT